MFVFENIVKAGSGLGAGFVDFPESQETFHVGDTLRVYTALGSFVATVCRRTKSGFYVPRSYTLLGSKEKFQVELVTGILSNTNREGRAYLPLVESRKHSLKPGDVIQLRIGNQIKNVMLLGKTSKPNEIHFTLGKEFANCEINYSFQRKLRGNVSNYRLPIYVASQNVGIIFDAKFPTEVYLPLVVDSYARYLGAYFADGTKKGFNWGICASTVEQAHYYLENHRRIIHNPSITLSLSITHAGQEMSLRELQAYWRDMNIQTTLIRKRKGKPGALKLSPQGTLVVKENRVGVLHFYQYLLDELFVHMRKTSDKNLAVDFICGVLEGDGTVNAKKRGHVQIATNNMDYPKIEEALKIAKIQYRLVREGKNRFYFRIGAIEILVHLGKLGSKIFQYYPKRRKNFILRLISLPTVQFILGNFKLLRPWIKLKFQKAGLLGKNGLTKKGFRIRNYLQKMIDELPRGETYGV